MNYRTGTYFAFDGLGRTNPTQSDFKYYSTVQAWAAGKHIDFRFVNSHDKAGAVRDSSLRTTLEASIRKRLAASKNMVAIISNDTRLTGSMLTYEIEKAVDTYELPLIIAYPNYISILDPQSLSFMWPIALLQRIEDRTVSAIHVPFKKDAILDAIQQFTVNSGKLIGPLNYYSKDTQVAWGYIS